MLPRCSLALAAMLALVAVAQSAPPARRLDRYGDPLPAGAVARLGTLRFNRARVGCVVFTPDGKSVVSGGLDGRVHVWDRQTGREVRGFRARGDQIDLLALSPNGRLIATVAHSEATQVRLYILALGWPYRRFLGHTSSVRGIAFSPDGKTLASCAGDSVRIWDVSTEQGRSLEGAPSLEAGDVCCEVVAFSPDGTSLIAGDSKGVLYFWDTSTWKLSRKLAGHASAVKQLVFPARGTRLVAGHNDHSVRFWDLAAGKRLHLCRGVAPAIFWGLALAPDGRTAAGSPDGESVRCWDTITGKERWRARVPEEVTSLAFSPRGKVVAVPTDYRIVLLDAPTGKCLNPTRAPVAGVTRLAFSPDGKTLVAGCDDQGVVMWDAHTWEEQSRWMAPKGAIRALRVGSSGRVLVATLEDGQSTHFKLRNISTGQPLGQVEADSKFLAIGPGGASIVISTPDGLVLRETSSGRILRRFPDEERERFAVNARRYPQPSPAVAFSPDGRLIAAGSLNGNVLCDARTATLLRRFGKQMGQAHFIAFSPDGKSILTQAMYTRDDSLCLWETASGQLRLSLKGLRGSVSAAAFSPDGRLLAASGPKGGFHLWDLTSGKRVGEVRGDPGRVAGHLHGPWRRLGGITPLAFSPDGRHLVSSGEDTTALVWEVGHFVPSRRPEAKLPSGRMEELWQQLAGEDAEKAYRAIWALAGQPGRVEPFLQQKLRRGDVSRKQVRKLIAELDSEEFATRDKASKELAKLGHWIRRELEDGLRRSPSLEVTWRIRQLLRRLSSDQARRDELRTHRAFEVLGHLGTPEARRLLEAHGAGPAPRR
jgi:WD40 repeat protein